MQHYVYLVNRFNLKDRTDDIIAELKKASEAFHRDYEIVVSETAEEALSSLSRFRDTNYVITAIGGDGSINMLLNALVGTDNILSFIPHGTGNDFYRMCAKDLENGIHEADLIKVNDRYCINVACFGIDADIANDESFIHNRFIPRPLRFNTGVVYHFLKFKKGRRLKVTCGKKVLERDFTTVVAANSQYYGCGYNVSPESSIQDGIMEVFLVRSLRKIRMALLILSMKKAGHLNDPAVKMLRTKKLVVSAEKPFSANIDGEPLRADRFELEMIPRGIRIDFNRDFLEHLRI